MEYTWRKWEEIEKQLPKDKEEILLSGKVLDIREGGQSCTLLIQTEQIEKVLIYADFELAAGWKQQNLQIGSRIRAGGEVRRLQQAGNPGQFDQNAYYHSKEISLLLFAREVWVLSAGSPYLHTLYRIRCFCSRILQKISSEQDQGIFRAALLGEKEGINENLKNLYQRSGIAHLLAISGLHLSLIGMGVYKLFRRIGLGYGSSGIFAMAGVASYGILTGASGSAVRAMLMLAASFFAAYLGRTYDLLSALSLAALLLLVSNPFLLVQSGFQLSFGAVLGISIAGRQIEKGLRIKAGWLKTLAVSLAVQLATAPILLWHYFQYPVYGIFLNLLVVPLMGYVIISGFLGIAAGMFSFWAGVAAVGSGHYLLLFYQQLCRIASYLPGGQAVWGRPRVWQIVLYYSILTGTLWGIGKKKENEQKIGICKKNLWILGAGIIFCVISLRQRPQQGCDVAVLDVGQGDGIVIQSEPGKISMQGIQLFSQGNLKKKNSKKVVVLIDGGSSSEKQLGKNRLEPYLKFEGITQIDFALVSHGDTDHISGLVYLLEECADIQINTLILPQAGINDEGYAALISAAKGRGTEIGYMDEGDRITAGDLRFTCLYPREDADVDFSDRNQQSLIVKADYQDFHMLFTGDASQEGEALALEYAGREVLSQVQVLKAAHHGSRFSSKEEFLQAVNPVWTVISYQEGNSYGHPHHETLERIERQGSQILETGKMGAVFFHAEKGKLTCHSYRRKSRND